jgi:hypothetical protein
VARAEAGGHIHVWDARNGRESNNFIPAPEGAPEARFTDNGKYLVTA